MSDVDRLREAAATQDDHGEGKAIADLLRALADARDVSNATPWVPGERPVRFALSDAILAALALADVLLAGDDD